MLLFVLALQAVLCIVILTGAEARREIAQAFTKMRVLAFQWSSFRIVPYMDTWLAVSVMTSVQVG